MYKDLQDVPPRELNWYYNMNEDVLDREAYQITSLNVRAHSAAHDMLHRKVFDELMVTAMHRYFVGVHRSSVKAR